MGARGEPARVVRVTDKETSVSWWIGKSREEWGAAVKAREADLRRLTHDGRLMSTAHIHQMTRKQRKQLEEETL